MRIAEQLSTDDPGEPPSLELIKKHNYGLLEAQSQLEIYPPYPRYKSETGEFECVVLDDYTNIEIKASLSGLLAEKYKHLTVQERFDLEEKVSKSMGKAAFGMFGGEVANDIKEATVALMNNLPVMFEPMNHAMLVGYWVNEECDLMDDEDEVRKTWDKWQKKKMHFKSQYIETYDQQRLLLSGLAEFVTYLEQQ